MAAVSSVDHLSRVMEDFALKATDAYGQIFSGFRWNIPELYNIGVDVCDGHAKDNRRLALI
jgi:hypothetical protein